MKEWKNIENEIKLTSQVNSQLKMAVVENQKETHEKLELICDLLGISIVGKEKLRITDEYYDTSGSFLKEKGFALRKRIEKSEISDMPRYLITIKAKVPLQDQDIDGIARYEWESEFTKTEADNKIATPSEISKIIESEFSSKLLIPHNLGLALTIDNMRTRIFIVTDIEEYDICLDKYYVRSSLGYSEYHYEIEIEKKYGLIEKEKDEKLTKLHKTIKLLFNYDNKSISKYKTARDFVKKIKNMAQVFTVMFDIVGFSKKTAFDQKNSIQLLTSSVKHAMRLFFSKIEHTPYLPTGDGLIVILESGADKIIDLCYEVQKLVKSKTDELPNVKKLSFKTGINVGNVFKYSDINESLNFAGGGINKTARVTGIGKEWHILATYDFHEYMKDMNAQQIEDFHDIGVYTVKHREKIRVYNVYNDNFGNPSSPCKLPNFITKIIS